MGAMPTPPIIRPMLASTGPLRGVDVEWSFEPKFDGWRVSVAISGGVVVRTRHGNQITEAVPELGPLEDALQASQVVLDGELIAGQGRALDFYRMAPRLSARRSRAVERQRRVCPLTFVAFDVLWLDGPVMNEPYSVRRSLLEGLCLDGPAWCTAPQLLGAPEDLLSACALHDLEGVVAKRVDSTYRSGQRSPHWIKLKTRDWRAVHGPLRTTARAL